MGKTSAAVKNKYNEKAYDRIALIVKKGQKEIIKAQAEKQGISINAYITKLIEKDIDSTEIVPKQNHSTEVVPKQCQKKRKDTFDNEKSKVSCVKGSIYVYLLDGKPINYLKDFHQSKKRYNQQV